MKKSMSYVVCRMSYEESQPQGFYTTYYIRYTTYVRRFTAGERAE
jgi:hypothetical protein